MFAAVRKLVSGENYDDDDDDNNNNNRGGFDSYCTANSNLTSMQDDDPSCIVQTCMQCAKHNNSNPYGQVRVLCHALFCLQYTQG